MIAPKLFALIVEAPSPPPYIHMMELESGEAVQPSTITADNTDKNTIWKDCNLAFRTLGVVFGSIATSPLYVYPSMNLRSPTEDHYLGIYSVLFWTLTLIGVIKYVFIALNANDQGEGGTFALYSLLCRHVNLGSIPSGHDSSVSSHTEVDGTENRARLGTFIEHNKVARSVLLFVAMLGMCMLIGDGILTPAISVLSAVQGLQGRFPSVGKSAVEIISVSILIVLFMLQKFGTSRVSFLFSPIIVVWTLATLVVGLHSIIHNYLSIFKVLSPHYVIRFFLQNGKAGWQLLGSTVLCITGAEAMFADIGHFNRRSIQIAFLCAIYPSLVLNYGGQTAYLIRHPDAHENGFYAFIPSAVYWPMFVIATLAAIVASQSLISAVFSVIKQAIVFDYFPRVKVLHTSRDNEGEVYSPEVNYILMILGVAVILIFRDGKDIGNAYGVVVIIVMIITTLFLSLVMIIIWRTPSILVALFLAFFLSLEGAYLSAVSTKILKGGWLPFAISIILVFIMYGWYYGRQRKMEYEYDHKITTDDLRVRLSNSVIQRVPGICFFYSNVHDGLTPILGHYINKTRSLHQVTIFTTLRYLLVAKVSEQERITIRSLGLSGLYACTIRYGYTEMSTLSADELVEQVTKILRAHILSMDDKSDASQDVIDNEILELETAKATGVVHFRGKTSFYITKETGCFSKLMLRFYELLHSNCRSALPAMKVPPQQCMEVGMYYEV